MSSASAETVLRDANLHMGSTMRGLRGGRPHLAGQGGGLRRYSEEKVALQHGAPLVSLHIDYIYWFSSLLPACMQAVNPVSCGLAGNVAVMLTCLPHVAAN